MQWKVDLENLVAQTKAMIRSTNHKSIRATPSPEVPPDVVPSEISPPKPSQPLNTMDKVSMAQMTWLSPAREEITQRVAGFKAHQEKMRREREDYYRETIAKTRALLVDDGKSNPSVPLNTRGTTTPD